LGREREAVGGLAKEEVGWGLGRVGGGRVEEGDEAGFDGLGGGAGDLLRDDAGDESFEGVDFLGEAFGREEAAGVFVDEGFHPGVDVDEVGAGFFEEVGRGGFDAGELGGGDSVKWLGGDDARSLGGEKGRVGAVRVGKPVDGWRFGFGKAVGSECLGDEADGCRRGCLRDGVNLANTAPLWGRWSFI
jgi:hypothetical protein